MWQYNTPLRDMRFVIEAVLNAPASWLNIPHFQHLDIASVDEILAAAGQFSSEILAPTNAAGDQAGCKLLDNGEVKSPPGFREAYQAFVDAGWPTLACEEEDGGQGLPLLLQAAVAEMLAACNHAWAMYPGLAHGAYECLKAHAEPSLRDRYLPKIVSGEWLAAMALTEAHAGSDLSLIRSQAELATDGSVRVTGSKIFISAGEHDLSDNIIHLVLCRLPGAPVGNKGLSLVLVPKILPDGMHNSLRCIGIEKKMGIHGNVTCAMAYEGATGWVVGQPHRGLSAMFVMMNSARLHVGLQGLGHLEMATQNAVRYAQDRMQMRAPIRPEVSAQKPADPIAAHPAVRRILASAAAHTEGSRVLSYWTALLIDEATHHPDIAQRKQAADFAALLTPVVKAFITDCGHRGADEALQVWGGSGFLHDYGIEQTVRDSRITLIYEGTNEIQAIDLLVRKVLDDQGARLKQLLATLNEAALRCGDDQLSQLCKRSLTQQIEAMTDVTDAIIAGHATDLEWPYRVAGDYLRAFGYLLMTWAWTRTISVALAQASSSAWLKQKLAVAQFGIEWLAPETHWHLQRVLKRDARLPEFLTTID